MQPSLAEQRGLRSDDGVTGTYPTPPILPRSLRLCSHLIGKVDDVRGNQVEIAGFGLVWHARCSTTELVRSRNESCTETIIAGSLQVAGVGRTHHHLFRL